MFKKVAGAGLGFLMLAAPALALAQASPDSESVIASLMAQIAQLQQQLGLLTGSTARCVDIHYRLSNGASDLEMQGEVTLLQRFLRVRTSGVFDDATELAVQKWQSSHGLVSSGTPETTGFGAVGPLTRRAMACNPSSQAPTLTVSASPGSIAPGGRSTISWSSTNATSCTAYENGSPAQYNPEQIPLSGSDGESFQETKTYTFTCTGPGGAVTRSLTITVNNATLTTIRAVSTTRPNITYAFTNLPTSDVQGVYLVKADTGTNVASSPVVSGSIRMPDVSPAGRYFLRILAVMNNRTIAESAPFDVASVGSTTSSNGALTFSTDSSTPNFQIVAAGTSGQTLGVFKFRPTGEDYAMQKITLQLTSGNPSDLIQATIWDSAGVLRGTAVFAGNSATAVATLSNPISLTKDTDTRLIVKGDISRIGVAQPGNPGDLVKVDVTSTQGYGISSGTAITGTGTTNTAGVRVFRSYPTITRVGLPANGLSDGKLLRFAVTANPTGDVGIAQFNFRVSASNATVSTYRLAAYSDSAYSIPVPVPGNTVGLNTIGNVTYNEVGGVRVNTTFNGGPLQVPAGQTRYFELRANVVPTNGATVVATLLGDSTSRTGMLTYTPINPSQLFADYFAWSPNDTTTSQFTDSDWTNGYGIPGLPQSGLSQTRTDGGTTSTPTITASVTPSTAVNGASTAQLKWDVTNAPSGAAIEIGISGTALNAGADATFPFRNIVSPYPLDGTTRTVNLATPGQTSMPTHGTINFVPNYFSGYLPISGPINFTLLDSAGNVLSRASAPLQITAGGSTAGAVTFSTDSSSPAHQIVAGGTSNQTLGVFKFRPTGEDYAMQRITLQLTSGRASDLNQINIYDSAGVLRGTALFVGDSTTAGSTLSNPISLTKDTDTKLIVKGAIAPIGVGQPGTPGDLISVNLVSTEGYGISSGSNITGTGSTNVAGVRMFRSFPTVWADPLPSTGLADGRLLRFRVNANSTGDIGIGQMKFRIIRTNGTSAAGNGQVALYAYTDSSYSSIAPGVVGGLVGTASITAGDEVVAITASQPFQIPAGSLRYFELRSIATNGLSSVTATLLRDDSPHPLISFSPGSASAFATYNFIWSPNDLRTSAFSDSDWTNGYFVQGIPPSGLSQTRIGSSPATPLIPSTVVPPVVITPNPTTTTVTSVPTGTLSVTPCTIGSGSTLQPTRTNVCDSKISWSTTNASSAYVTITGSSPYLRNIYPYGYTPPRGTGLTKTDVPYWTPAGTYTVALYVNGTYPTVTRVGTGTKVAEQTVTVLPAVPTSTGTTTAMTEDTRLNQIASAIYSLQLLIDNWGR